MKMAWNTTTGQLTRRWSGAGLHVEYRPPWMWQSSPDTASDPPENRPLDIARMNAFGPTDWYGPALAGPSQPPPANPTT